MIDDGPITLDDYHAMTAGDDGPITLDDLAAFEGGSQSTDPLSAGILTAARAPSRTVSQGPAQIGTVPPDGYALPLPADAPTKVIDLGNGQYAAYDADGNPVSQQTIRQPPEPTFAENLGRGFVHAAARGLPAGVDALPLVGPALGAFREGEALRSPGEGAGGFVGGALGGLTGIADPRNAAGNYLAMGAGSAVKAAAMPALERIAQVAGPRVASIIASAVENGTTTGGMGMVEHAQQEDWANDPAGALGRTLMAGGVAAAGGAVGGGAFGAMGKLEGRAPEVRPITDPRAVQSAVNEMRPGAVASPDARTTPPLETPAQSLRPAQSELPLRPGEVPQAVRGSIPQTGEQPASARPETSSLPSDRPSLEALAGELGIPFTERTRTADLRAAVEARQQTPARQSTNPAGSPDTPAQTQERVPVPSLTPSPAEVEASQTTQSRLSQDPRYPRAQAGSDIRGIESTGESGIPLAREQESGPREAPTPIRTGDTDRTTQTTSSRDSGIDSSPNPTPRERQAWEMTRGSGLAEGQKVRIAGAEYRYVRDNADGTITVASESGEFSTEPGEKWTPLAVVERKPERGPEHVSRRDFVGDSVDRMRASRLARVAEVEAKIDAVFRRLGKTPGTGYSAAQTLSMMEKPRGELRGLASEYRIAKQNAAMSLDDVAKTSAAAHRLVVENAVRAGRPVPPEVLADYPDLKPATPKVADATPDVATPAPATPPPVESRSAGAPISRWDVYPIEVKGRGTRYAVRESADPRGFGDTIHETPEAAAKYASESKEREAKNAAFRAAENEKASAEAARKAADADVDGFADDKPPMVRGRAVKSLQALARIDGDVKSIRDHVRAMVADGPVELTTREEPKIQPMSRAAFNRADSRQQAAHEAKMKAAGTKTVYLVNGRDLGKTGYEYAAFLRDKPKGPEPAPKGPELSAKGPETSPGGKASLADRLEASARDKIRAIDADAPPARDTPPQPPAVEPTTTAGAPVSRDERITSARKAMTAADREAMGLGAMDNPERRGWEEALDTAREKGLNKKETALALAADVNERPRAFDDVETAGLVEAANDLKNRHAELMQGVDKLTDRAEIFVRAAEIDRVETDFDNLTQALRKSGTEKGRALASQKLTLNADNQLVSVLNRAKVKKGAELSPAERAKFEDLTKRLEERSARVTELEKQIAETQAEQAVKRRAGRKRAMPAKAREAEYASLLSKAKELIAAGCD